VKASITVNMLVAVCAAGVDLPAGLMKFINGDVECLLKISQPKVLLCVYLY
jgi:hypothetical protein